MKIYNGILVLLAVAAVSVSCMNEQDVAFDVDTDEILMGPEGGVRTFKVSSSEMWVARSEEPWITVSPANGRGSVECRIIVDSTLKWNESRVGKVSINGEGIKSRKSFTVTQNGYDYQIAVSEPQVNISDYADYGKRSFKVKVKANVDFKVKVPDNAINWLIPTKPALNLDREARPREVEIKFEWKVNSMPMERIADVVFEPVKNVQMGRHDGLKVVQKSALPIPEGTVEGDSLALLAVNRSLGVWTEYETSEKMENWTGVDVWQKKHLSDPNDPEQAKKLGRVKSASFAAFTTKEGIPFEVQYLTAAEELSFYGNTNTFLIESLDCGPYICMLTSLKRLTIGAYGLNALHEDFRNLVNLEYLNLESNNFQTVPDVLDAENFTKLRSLILNANTRFTVTDLYNDVRDNVGGFVEEPEFPTRLLTWNKLDTLRLSANYLQGRIPSDERMRTLVADRWTTAELKDSLADGSTFFDENDVPKVLPNADFFAINLNRLYGELPMWILYHPKLDLWAPDLLVWSQEGRAKDGTMAGFSNAPTNMNYYYSEQDRMYVKKKFNPKNYQEEE